LTLSLLIIEGDATRRLDADHLPLAIGGKDAEIEISGDPQSPLAHIGEDQGELFIQPTTAAGPVRCNGDALATSRWLQDGDSISVEGMEIKLTVESQTFRLEILRDQTVDAGKPTLIPPPRALDDGPTNTPEPTSGEPAQGILIAPAEYMPHATQRPGRRSSAARWAMILTWITVTLLAAAAWFTFTARTVELQIEPVPDRVDIVGTALQFEIGGRHLLRPGSYSVVVEKEGYRRLTAPLEVTEQSNQVYSLSLEQLPGLLDLQTRPAVGVAVVIDGQEVGTTPLEPIELPSGEHRIDASASRYRTESVTVATGGSGSTTTLEVTLSPLWASVSFDSSPRGAQVRVDGKDLGRTPLSADLLGGRRTVEFRLDGHKSFGATLRVVAEQPLVAETATLQPVEGWLSLTTEPAGASISIGSEYRGVSPLEIELAPEIEYEISASLRAHQTTSETIRIASGQTHELHLALIAETGEVEIIATPPDAEVFVDGVSHGVAGQTLHLTAEPHQIEVRKSGYQAVAGQVTPRPGFPQTIELELETEEEARATAAEAARKPTGQTSQGQEMRLIPAGRLRMGASRREPGRRSNETLREVEITRPFYLATEEVSNREFREFRDGHRAGAAGENSLDLDDHPVVKITWEDAARYCNWLSTRESLTPFYSERGGVPQRADPHANGYRLPTEAEWAWAARYEGGTSPRKYPWGDTLPVAAGAGNYADASAKGLLPSTITGFNDSHAATAAVDSFAPNAIGLFNLGGNVAEWVHDFYSIYSSADTGVDQDPTGPREGQYHVIRGAGWMDSTISELRLSYRDYGDKARPDVGFRIARNAD
jgi:formylglycine-generating enzyme required for sulfatase activity